MSSSYDAMMRAFRERQDSLSVLKQRELERSSETRRKYLDPSRNSFNPDEWEVKDFDTFYNPNTKETLRISGGEGRTLNAFETNPDRYQGDAKAEQRFKYHRQAYAKLFGKDVDDVDVEDLTNMGQVQAERMRNKLEKLRGVGFRRKGQDEFNRTLVEFEDNSVFEEAMGIEGNAAYFAPQNYRRLLQDIATGDRAELRRETRSLLQAATDQIPNFLTGGGRMANDLGQAIATILQVNGEGVDNFFKNNREWLDEFKERSTSRGQKDRERFANKRAGIREELFTIRKQKYIEQGDTETTASIKASLEAYGDTIGDLIDEPGRILDAAVESLPYMIGVGAVGRAVATAATRRLAARTLNTLKKSGADKAQIDKYMKKYMSGKEAQSLISRAANSAGIATVGVTEGLSNAAETYASTVGMTEEEAQRSDRYKQLREQGLSHKEATRRLGESIFWQTLITTTGLAAAASAVTGAGAFEAGLFRIAPKAARTGKEAAEQATEGAIKAAASTVGRGAKYVTGPGLKEFAEESIQSGGGEFLSQLAEYDEGLIDQIGPGIGEATAEGGVVGFASGAGAAAITGGPKALVRKLNEINRQYSESKVGEVTIRSEGSPLPGGQTNTTPIDSKKGPFAALMDQVKKMTDGKAPDVSQYKQLESQFLDSYAAMTPEERESSAQALRTLRHLYHAKLKQEVDATLAKDPEEYTEEDRQNLFSGVEEGLVNPDEVKGPLGRVLKRFANADQAVSAAMDDASDEQTIATVREATGQSDLDYRRVAQEKLDDVNSSKGPGLKRHIRLLKEAARLNDPKLWGDRAERFERFLQSQESKVARVESFLNDVTAEGADVAAVQEAYGLEYKEGSTEAYLKILQAEQVKMNQAVEEVTQAYNEWKAITAPEADTAAAPVEPETTTQPRDEEPEVPDQVFIDKAREIFESDGIGGTRRIENAAAAVRQGGNDRGATILEQEFDRLVTEAAEERQRQNEEEQAAEATPAPEEGRTDNAPTGREGGTAQERVEETANEEEVQTEDEEVTEQEVQEEVKPLEEQTVPELRKKASELKIKGRSKLRKAALVRAIQVKQALAKLPQALQDVIQVVFDENPILDRKAKLSLKSNLADAGITDPNALRWAFKNKDLPGLKNVKSEKDLRQLAAEQWIAKNERANKRLDELNSEELIDAVVSWHVALRDMVKIREDDLFMNSHDVFFMEIMTDVFLKELLDTKRQRPAVPVVNKHALRETYQHYLENTGFQGMAKHYKRLVAQYSLMSSKTEPSSGQGEWVIIPQTERDHPMYDTNVKKLQELSPSTWCTASWAAPDHVRGHENVLLIVNGQAVVGLELLEEKPRNVVQERIDFLERMIELHVKSIERREADIAHYESDESWGAKNGQPHVSLDRAKQLRKHNEEEKENLKQARAELAEKQEELKTYEPPPAKIRIVDSTRVANDGVSSIDFLDETLAYLEERGIDYSDASPIQRAIALKEKGKTDKDAAKYGYDDVDDIYEDWEYDDDNDLGYDAAAEAQAELERRQMHYEHTLVIYEDVLSNLQSVIEGTHIFTAYSFQEIVNENIKASRNVDKLRDPMEKPGLMEAAYISQGIIGPQMYDLTPLEYMVFTAEEWAELYDKLLEEFAHFQEAGPEADQNGFRYLNLSLATDRILAEQIQEATGVELDYRRGLNVGGQGFNYSGYWLHALEKVLKSNDFAARNIAKYIFENRISPLLYEPGSTLDDIVLTEEGLYALATTAATWYSAANPDVPRRELTIPEDSSIFRSHIDGMSEYQATPERVAYEPNYVDEPVPVTKEFLQNESRMMIPVDGDTTFTTYKHQQIFLIRDNFRRDEARRYVDGNDQVPRVIWDEVPFSRTDGGGIQGWSIGNSAVINAAHTTPERAPAIGLHEVAHLGINRVAEVLGGKDELFTILKGAEAQLMEKSQQLIEEDGFGSVEELAAAYGYDLQTQEGQLQLLIELTARWAEHFANRPPETWWQNLIEALGNWVRKFVGKELTQEEVDAMVAGFIRYGVERPGSKVLVAAPIILEPTTPVAEEVTGAEAQPEAERTAEVADEGTALDRANSDEEIIAALEAEIARDEAEQSPPIDQEAAQEAYDDLQYFDHVVQGFREGRNSEAQVRYVLESYGVVDLPEGVDLNAVLEEVRGVLESQVPEGFTPREVDEQTLRNLQEKTRKLGEGEKVYARDSLEDTVPITDPSRMEQLFKWASIPFGKNAEANFERVLERVRNGYKSGKNFLLGLNQEFVRLPEKLSDHFVRRSDKVNSLLASIKDLAELLDDRAFRNTFRREAKLNVGEDIALTRFKDFRHELAAKFQEMIQDLNHPMRGRFAGEWLKNNPLYYFKDELGQMDSNVITAMALEAMNWLAASRLHATPHMMNRILGRDGNQELTDSEIAMLSDKVHLRSQVYTMIGNAAVKQLNLKRRDDSPYDAEMHDKLAVALGLAAIATMQQTGYVQVKKLPRSWLAAHSEQEVSAEGPDILFVHPTPSSDPNSYDVDQKVADIRESRDVGKRVFEQFFGSATMARYPSDTTPTKKDVPTRISRSLTRISKIMRDRIHKMQQRPWQANMPVINLVNRFLPQDLLAMSYEYNTDMDSVHADHEKARQARNQSYLLELDQARKWGETRPDDVFYFTYHMSQSGRVFISSNTINPQTSKIHRFLFGMTQWNQEVKMPRLGATNRVFRNFLLSVAQGMDIPIDKLSQKDSLKALREKLELDNRYLPTAESPMNQVLEIINGDGQITQEQLEILRPFVEDTGVHALAALQAYSGFVEAHSKGERSFMSNLPIETDGITNGLSLGMLQTPTLQEGFYQKIKNMLRATGIMFENDPTSFAGWIRNGQNKDNYVDTANRVGELIQGMINGELVNRENDTRHENWQKRDELIRKHANAYNVFSSNFLPSMEELFAEGGKGRNWAKNPLMITGYGASLVAIINSIAEKAYDKFLEDMALTNEITANVTEENAGEAYAQQLQAMLNLINQAYDFVELAGQANVQAGWFQRQYEGADTVQWTMEELLGKLERDYDNDIRRMAREFRLDQKFPGVFNEKTGKTSPTKTAADLFKDTVKATYGEAMAVALQEKLQPVEEIRQELNAANKLMNEIFVRDYARRLALYQERLGRTLNSDERREIFEQMFAQGLVPSVAMAYSDPKDLTQNLETTSYDREPIEESQVNLVLTRSFQIVNETYDELTRDKVEPPTQQNITAALLAKIPDTDVGVSAVVKLIHAMDGANNSFAWGNDWSVLNMHDAQISSIDEVDEVVTGVNKDLRELMGKYSLPGAMLQSLERMLPLLDDTDPRLTRAEKDAIYKSFTEHRLKHGMITEEQAEVFSEREIFERFLNELEQDVVGADYAREQLLSESTSFGQYSLEGLEYVIDDIDYSFKGYEKVRTGEQERKRQSVVDNLLLNARSGNLRGAVLDWINKDRPDFRTALQITQAFLVQAFENSESPEIRQSVEDVRKLTSLLWPHLRSYSTEHATRIVTVPEMYQEDDPDLRILGLYVPSEDSIRISRQGPRGGISIIDTLLHEILHAANSTLIWRMQFENADRFDELTEMVREAIADMEGKVTEGRSSKILKILQGHMEKREYDSAITEYISYVMASYVRQDKNSVVPIRGFDDLVPQAQLDAMRILTEALRTDEGIGGLVLHSSPNEVNHANFAGKANEQIETKNLQELFDRLGQLDQQSTNPEHRHQLQNLINRVLLPGLKSIAPLMYQYATAPGTMQHAGEWRAQNNLVRVQSAGNALTNNAEMSLQEIFTHEVLHAISKAAFGDPSITDEQIKAAPEDVRKGLIQMRQGNPKLRNELERIFEQVRDAKDENGDPLITWRSFMPEVVVGDRQGAERAAKARYDHIFNGGAESIHEFFSIALTNHEFATVLSTITNRDTRGPIWDGGILSSLVNLLDRVMQWITGQMLKTNQKSIHASLFSLAQAVVDFNDRAALELDSVNDKKLLRNRVDEWINRNSERFLDRVQERLRRKPGEQELDTSLLGFARNATHAALVRRRKAGREAQDVLLRRMGVEKDSWISRIASEVVSYNEEDKGTGPGQPGFIDLLGHSKYQIDVARQRMIEHSHSTLTEAFDPNKRLTKAQRESLTHVVLRTDLDGLFENDPEVNDLRRLLSIIRSEDVRTAELDRAISELQAVVGNQKLVNMLLNQTGSMANLMIKGKATVKNSMMNAHNIVKQYNRAEFRRQPIQREDDAIALIERIGTLMAMGLVDAETRQVAAEVLEHELDREIEDNGFSVLLGMHSDFKYLAREHLFRGNPTQMIKGYVYEMLDDDINVQFVKDTPENRRMMKDQGMVLITPDGLTRDSLDTSKAPRTLMYKGLHGGLGGYQKSIVSLTNLQHRGYNLYGSHDYDSQSSLENLGRMRTKAYNRNEQQSKEGWTDEDQNMVPVLDENGNITDYRYLMTETVKKEHFKKRDEFDRVLSRMFGSISDRVGTVDINRQVVDLLYDEHQKYGPNSDDNPHRFVMVGESVPLIKKGQVVRNPDGSIVIDKNAQAMWRLLPDDMQRAIVDKFGTKAFPIRDNAVNLVLGFRKLSIADNKYLGKSAFITRAAEKVWLEAVQFLRVKVALLTPEVVIGNTASNYAILLSEGIPVNYIRKMTGEALKGIRKYQNDVKRLDKTQRYIGIRQSQGKDTRNLEREAERLQATLRANPVDQLIQEGMYTSIVEELGNNEDTLRERGINWLLDHTHGKIPSKLVKGASELYMLPGTRLFHAAQLATQYGDFVGRYIKYKYDTEVRGKSDYEAKHDALAAFIYYDMPQHRSLQFANDYGFVMFTKFFARIQHVIANLFLHHPTKAAGVLAVQQALAPALMQENIANYALMSGATRKFEPIPFLHIDRIEPWDPSLLMWLRLLGIGG